MSTAKGHEIAKAYISLTVKASGIKSQIEQHLGKVDVSQHGQAIGSRLSEKIGNALKTGLKVSATTAAAVLGTALTKGFGRLKAIEDAQAKMRGLGYDADTISAAMTNALNSVKGTAFGLGDAAKVASQVMAAGIQPGADLERTLKAVSNAAALAGADFGEMGSIFAKAATQANGVQNDVLAQLADRGIPIYQKLAEVLNVTAGEVFKLASEGKVDFATFQQAAELAAGSAAEAMGGTTTGAFNNMNAALGRLGAKILEDIFPLIAPLFQNITAWLDTATANVEPLIEEFKRFAGYSLANLKTAWEWFLDNSSWIGTITAAIVAGVVAWKTYIAVTTAWKTVIIAAQVAQAAFNAVLAANPIGLIITAIAALAAGLTWFFTQTELGQQVWAEFTRFLGEAWANISAWFKELWETSLKPVFDAIGAIVTWLWENILQPIVNLIVGYIQFLGQWYTWLWESIISPIIQVWAAIFTWLWENILSPVINFIVGYIQFLGSYYTWLWETIVQPVINAIGAIITWLWENIIKPVFDFIVWSIEVLAAAFTWLWENAIQPAVSAISDIVTWLYETIIKPVFDAIGATIKWVWENLIKPAFNRFQEHLNTLGAVFTWLYETIIKPVWDAISTVISTVWENGIKPVIDTLVKIVQEDPKKAFEAARDAIGEAWAGIQSLAKEPVRFVVDTVINGLIDTINLIPGVNLARISLPKGFRDGGYTGNFGYNTVAGIVHGNEHVIRAESRRKLEAKHPGLLDHMNRTGTIPGYRTGGLVTPLKAGSYRVSQQFHAGHNGIDLAAAAGTPVLAAASGTAQMVATVPMGGKEIYLQHGQGGHGTRYSHLSRFATRQGQQVQQGQIIGYVGSTGMSTGPHLHYMVHVPPGDGGAGRAYRNFTNPAPYMNGTAKMLGEAWNPLTGLIDFVTNEIKKAFPAGGMWIDTAAQVAKQTAQKLIDIFTPKIGSDTGHTGKPTLYDKGGWLNPGLSLIANKTGKPEPILTSSQWDDVSALAAGSAFPRRLVLTVEGREFTAFVREQASEVADSKLEPMGSRQLQDHFGVR